jgi:6-phosphogluconolactonase (cycloisomerase 2 family)
VSVGALTALAPAFVTTGLGGHKVAVSPDGKHLYCCNESAKTVTMYKRGAGGVLEALAPETIATGTGPTDIQITPDGKHVYVANAGTTTVSVYSRNAETGQLTLVESAAAGASPRNIAISSDGKDVYATNSTGTTVKCFSRNEATGALTALGTPTATVGTEPRGIAVSPDGKNVYVANFGGKNVSQLTRNTETGVLSALAGGPLEASTGADIVAISPDGLNVYVTDFGKLGGPWGTTIHQFSRGAEGKLAALGAATVTCGEGPTDLTCSGDGKTVLVCCFQGGTLQVFTRGTGGALTLQESKATGKEMEGVCLSPDEKYAYAVLWEGSGEATHGRIYQFSRVLALGQLTLLAPKDVECGEEPQHVTASPDNKFVYVANAKAGTISCFKRGAGGVLEPLATRDVATGAGAYDISISPDGKFLYVCNRDASAAKAISQYSRNLSTGVITPLSPANVEMKGVVATTTEGAEHSGPHSIVMSDDGKFVYVCTQSKPGRVYQYARNTTTGLLTPLSPESFTTTRMLFDLRLSPAAGNPYAFGALLGVLNSKEAGEVIIFSRDATTGLLSAVEVVSAGAGAECCGALCVSPDGKNLYVTNKEPIPGNNAHGVSQFSIGAGGKLTLLTPATLETNEEPRGIWASPDGRNIYVCDQGERFIHCFDRDPETGLLSLKEVADTGESALWPSHGTVTGNACNYYAADKHVAPPKVSQFSRLAGPPAVTKPATKESAKGAPAELQIAATNTEEYEASGLPAGMSIDPISGLITGTPTTVEEPTVTITAKGTGGKATTTFKWKVLAETTPAPTITQPADQLSTVGVAIAPLAIAATNATEYKATGLPEGSVPEPFTINPATGVITGNPGKVQETTVTVTVVGPGGTASVTFKWKVEAAPTITTPAEQVGNVGKATSLQIAPAGQASYRATGLPAGLAVNEATGLISGTPRTVSTKTVTIKALNAAGAEAVTTFTWKIEDAVAPTVTKPADQTATRGHAISPLAIAATSTETYEAAGLPAGLAINPATGVITGTPTTAEAPLVTIKVKGPGGEATTTFTWTVAAPAPLPAGPVIPTAATADVTVRLQALDGTWETCGADRAVKVLPETLSMSANEWGPDKASFDLRRSPFALWPDIGAFSPVEIEVGGVLVWEGRTGETPIRAGAEQVINVQCQGWQYHLDDDVYQRAYVHSRLTDWKDVRSSLGANLAAYTSAPQVQTAQGMLSLTWPQGQAANGSAAVMLDLGAASTAARVVLTWVLSAGAANRAVYLGWGATPNGPDAVQLIYANVPESSGTFAFTLPTASSYIYLQHDSNSHTPAADETFKVAAVSVFASTAYESGNASVLHADTVVKDALARATILLAEDRSQIAATSFAIPDFTLSKASTPRETIEAANAYHNYITKLLAGKRVSFQPRPFDAVIEIGAWSGADIEDASANNGAEIYNRALVEAAGPDGSTLVVERNAGQQAGVLFLATSSPSPDNPSFAVDTASWTASGAGTITRNTNAANYHSAPACGVWEPGVSASTLSETFTGTFFAGVAYSVTFWAKSAASSKLFDATFGVAADHATAAVDVLAAYQSFTITWTPTKTVTGATLTLLNRGGFIGMFVDDLTLAVAKPTLADRRGFRRTKVIQMSSAITAAEGNQLADIFLQGHMTTPFKGSAAVSPGGVRTVLGGQPVHPSLLLQRTQQLLRLAHLIDPDTGGVGRDGTIAEVSYTHRDQKASVTLDDKRGNFDALLARLAVVQTVGS